ncbi:MAG: EamA family transporter [Comamonadaceae bacterium]|nr:EamA family transporter [Comamonadaceae bacterium]
MTLKVCSSLRLAICTLTRSLKMARTPCAKGLPTYLCLVGAVLAYALFFRGIRLLPPAVVSSLGLLSPVCAFALGWAFLDQRLSLPALLGFGLALCAIYGVQRALQDKASKSFAS